MALAACSPGLALAVQLRDVGHRGEVVEGIRPALPELLPVVARDDDQGLAFQAQRLQLVEQHPEPAVRGSDTARVERLRDASVPGSVSLERLHQLLVVATALGLRRARGPELRVEGCDLTGEELRLLRREDLLQVVRGEVGRMDLEGVPEQEEGAVSLAPDPLEHRAHVHWPLERHVVHSQEVRLGASLR